MCNDTFRGIDPLIPAHLFTICVEIVENSYFASEAFNLKATPHGSGFFRPFHLSLHASRRYKRTRPLLHRASGPEGSCRTGLQHRDNPNLDWGWTEAATTGTRGQSRRWGNTLTMKSKEASCPAENLMKESESYILNRLSVVVIHMLY